MADEFDGTLGFGDEPGVAFFRGGTAALRTAEELTAQFPKQLRSLQCPDCGARLVLKDGKYGIFYGCEKYQETGCKGSHNCNKTTAQPLGIPADTETRKARRNAHEVFDLLWKSQGLNKLTRPQAYLWMQQNLKLSEADAHIAMLDKAGCERLVRVVDRFLHPPTRFDREDPI